MGCEFPCILSYHLYSIVMEERSCSRGSGCVLEVHDNLGYEGALYVPLIGDLPLMFVLPYFGNVLLNCVWYH